MAWAKILTEYQFMKRGQELSNRHHMSKEEEIYDYILLHCLKACILWLMIFFLVSFECNLLVRGLLFSLVGTFVGKNRKKDWKVSHMRNMRPLRMMTE